MNRLTKKILNLTLLFILLNFNIRAQSISSYTYDLSNTSINCGGMLPEVNPIPRVLTPNCSASSPDYINKYSKQSTYIPNSNSPLITLKMTFHVILKTDGTGPYPISTGGIAELTNCANWMHNYQERYSVDPRNASYSTGDPLFITGPTGSYQDSKINYELTNIYYYYDNALNLSTDPNALFNLINSTHPGATDEGLPIIFNSGYYLGATGFQSIFNGAPYIQTFSGTDPWFLQSHLRHEIGHAFGLLHTYLGGCCPDILDCNASDFLCDVFPVNNSMCASGSFPCNICPEGSPNSSNNLMGGQGGNGWMSYLQMARKRRNAHLVSNNIRKFMKEMTSSTIAPWVITSNETWDFDIQMYEDIIVKSGNTLTIKCKVGMANNGRIVVERGARLIIDGGEVYAWGSSWSGIQVWGNSNQRQYILTTGLAPDHGIVDVINLGTLRDAVIAISTGKFFDNGDLDWGGFFGGIIRCNNAKFINNWKGVAYYTYHNKNIIGNIIPNVGYFFNSVFETTSNLKDSNLLTPDAFATLWAVDGVKFLGNTFRNTSLTVPSLDKRGNGIVSYDASFIVDRYKTGCTIFNSLLGQCAAWSTNNPSTFSNLQYGIYTQNTSPFNNIRVNDNDFIACNRGVYMGGTYYASITNNRINVGDGLYSIPFLPYGIYSENSSAYDISNNSIFTTQTTLYGQSKATGIVVNGSNGYNNTIYRNSMNMMANGTTIYGDNQGPGTGNGLKLKCNSYGQGSAGLNATDILMGKILFTNGKIDAMQGSPSKGANNYFTRNSNDFYDAYSTLIPSSNPVGSFNYYFNMDPSNKTEPLFFSPTLSPNMILQPLNYANMCPASLFSITMEIAGPRTAPFAKSIITANTASISILNTKLDGGNTQYLLNSINSMHPDSLENLLELNSPYLSDEVLSAYFNKNTTTMEQLKKIHDKNKPVNAMVWQVVLDKNLPNDILNDVIEQQSTSIISPMQKLYGEIADLNQQKGYIIDEVIRVLLNDTINGIDQATIIDLMKTDNRYDAESKLLSTYIALDKFTDATVLLASIKNNMGGVLDDFCKLQEILIFLKQQANSIFAIKTDTITKDIIEQMVYCQTDECSNGIANASALLKFIFNNQRFEFISLNNETSGSRLNNSNSEKLLNTSKSAVFKLYPNPSYVNADLYLSNNNSISNSEVLIFDIMGKLVITQKLDSEGTTHLIQTKGLDSGMYLVCVFINGEITDKQKLIIE